MSESAAAAAVSPVTVLYDDAWYVVVDKPSGLCVHDSAEVQSSSDDTVFVVDRAAGRRFCAAHHCHQHRLRILLLSG